jgi:hypothetical protein
MRYLLVLCFFCSFLYSQKKESTDSTAYYTNLANSSIKENKYTRFFTQKAINIATTMDKQSPNNQTYNLGVLYYNLNKYGDAKIFFNESTFDSKFTTITRGC